MSSVPSAFKVPIISSIEINFIEVADLCLTYPHSEGSQSQTMSRNCLLFELCECTHGSCLFGNDTALLQKSRDVPTCVIGVLCTSLLPSLDRGSKQLTGVI